MKYDSVDDLYDDESAGSGAAPDSNEVGSPDVDSLYDDDETDDKDKGDSAPPDADPPQETEEERTAREEEDARIAGLSDEEREAERVAALSDDEREAERREALTEEERAAEDAEIERRAGLTDEERAAEDEEAAEAAETPTNSVVEKFLEKFGVQGGVIEFEDGNSDHISSFDEETQLGILEEIVQSQQQTMEDKYGLSEVEVDLVNKLRSEDGPTLEDAISSMVSARVAEREAKSKFGGEVDYEGMEVDDIFTKYLKDNAEEGEELTDEDIAAELELVKKSKSYKKNVEAIRKNYISDRESKRKEWQDERKQEFKAAQDNEIQKVVDGVREVADVAGWKVDDKTKNEIIADLVELDENGTSAFTREIISDPKKMFEAQWYMKFGADYFSKMDTYYKGEIEKAKEIGKKEALAKKKAAPKVSATKKGGKDQKPKGGEKPKTTFSRKPNKVDSVDELYN